MTDDLTKELLEALANLQKVLDKVESNVKEAKDYVCGSESESESEPKQNE